MKVNLLQDSSDIRQGYKNIDPLGALSKEVIRDSLKELTSVDDGEAEEIVALDVVDYYTPEEAIKMIQTWAKKIAHGGTLTVGFTDIYRLTKSIVNRAYDFEEANVRLHGKQDKPWHVRRCTLSMDFVSVILTTVGFKILFKRFDNEKGIIKAIRP
jgi:hypothetical protein